MREIECVSCMFKQTIWRIDVPNFVRKIAFIVVNNIHSFILIEHSRIYMPTYSVIHGRLGKKFKWIFYKIEYSLWFVQPYIVWSYCLYSVVVHLFNHYKFFTQLTSEYIKVCPSDFENSFIHSVSSWQSISDAKISGGGIQKYG